MSRPTVDCDREKHLGLTPGDNNNQTKQAVSAACWRGLAPVMLCPACTPCYHPQLRVFLHRKPSYILSNSTPMPLYISPPSRPGSRAVGTSAPPREWDCGTQPLAP